MFCINVGIAFRQMTMLIQDLIKLSGSFRSKYKKDDCYVTLKQQFQQPFLIYIDTGMYDRKPYKEKLTDNLLSFCSNRGGTYLVSWKILRYSFGLAIIAGISLGFFSTFTIYET
jgi:hypothetical protein